MENSIINPETVSIRYIVHDVNACVSFYTKLLGFEVKLNPPSGFAMLSKGNMQLLLNEPGAGGAGESMPDGTAPMPGGWNRIQLQTKNINSVIRSLEVKGVKFRNELVIGNGGMQILLLDPSGNLIELVEPNR